jgi:Predicted integral membrane protein (DUF2269)
VNWLLFWLFLHILAAVIAFGPIFVFPVVGTLVAQSPQNMRFAVELNHRIETRLVLPLAASMLVSGSGLIWTSGISFFQTPFLIVAVVLYLLAMGLALGVLLPTTRKLLHIVEHSPAPAPSAGAPLAQIPALVRRNQIFGGLTTILFLVIIFLMVIQPGGIVLR